MGRTNKSQYAILGLINKRPMSGYDIKQIFSRFAPYHWSESNAQIYPMLKNLTKQGMLTAKIDQRSGARNRCIYSITEKGITHLNEWLKQPLVESVYREELLLKLSTSQHLPTQEIIKQIEQYAAQLKEKQAGLIAVFKHVDDDHQGRPDQQALRVAYRYSEMVLATKLAWCDYAKQTLATTANRH